MRNPILSPWLCCFIFIAAATNNIIVNATTTIEADCDRLAQMVLFNPSLQTVLGWDPPNNASCCSPPWSQIVCNSDGIVSLQLSSESFSGPLPTIDLPRLKELRFQYTGFIGTLTIASPITDLTIYSTNFEQIASIPETIVKASVDYNPKLTGNIAELFMSSCANLTYFTNMYSVSVTGSIPALISGCVKLDTFDVFGSNYSGLLPPALPPYMTYFDCGGGNPVSGPLPPTPATLKKLDISKTPQVTWSLETLLQDSPNLEVLWAYESNLNSTIPSNTFDVWTNMQIFELSKANAMGTIPASIWRAPLTSVKLDYNYLYGEIPPGLPNTLEFLSLNDQSAFNDSLGFSSSILMSDLAACTKLKILDLGNNPSLTGTIPPNIYNMSSVEYMWIQGCNWTGTIPPELGLLPNLIKIVIGSPSITGEIPASIGKMPKLAYFLIKDTPVTGSLPATFADLLQLKELQIVNTDLSGTIPPGLDRLQNLGVVAITGNGFSGCAEPFYFANWYCDVSNNQFDANCTNLCWNAAIPPIAYVPYVAPTTECSGSTCNFICSNSVASSGCQVQGSANITGNTTLVVSSSGVTVQGNLTISSDVTLKFVLPETPSNTSLLVVQECLQLSARQLDISIGNMANLTQLNNSVLIQYSKLCSSIPSDLDVTSNIDSCASGVTATVVDTSSQVEGRLSLVFALNDPVSQSACSGNAPSGGLVLSVAAIAGIAVGAVVLFAIIILVIILSVKALRHRVMPFESRRLTTTNDGML